MEDLELDLNEINIKILEYHNKINELLILKRKMKVEKLNVKVKESKKEFDFMKELFKAYNESK